MLFIFEHVVSTKSLQLIAHIDHYSQAELFHKNESIWYLSREDDTKISEREEEDL